MAWRKVTAAAAGDAGPAVAELLAYAAECQSAGDTAGMTAAWSWLDMVAAAGYDPEVADFLAGFARAGQAEWRARRGVA